jgi:hypothetical protein
LVDAPLVDAPLLDAPLLDAPLLDAPLLDAPLLDAPLVDAPLLDAPLLDAPLVDAPLVDPPLADTPWAPLSGDGAPRTVGAPPAADSGSGRGLLTCGDIAGGMVDAPVDGPADGTAGAGFLVSGDGSRPGPNTKTCPTEMRKSAPMLFHRAKSRKSRSWRQAML